MHGSKKNYAIFLIILFLFVTLSYIMVLYGDNAVTNKSQWKRRKTYRANKVDEMLDMEAVRQTKLMENKQQTNVYSDDPEVVDMDFEQNELMENIKGMLDQWKINIKKIKNTNNEDQRLNENDVGAEQLQK